MPSILQRLFGRHADVKISALGFGGHHLGHAPDTGVVGELVTRN
jgi:hypothetical protein